MRKIKLEETETVERFVLSQEQAKTRYNLGNNMIDQVAKEADAIVYVGRRKLYVIEKLDKYFLKLAM